MFTSLKNTKKGFTLIELLVVIAIIGILSSVVLASLSTARQKSRDAKRISDIGQIQLALELYFDANQSYPSTTPTGFTGVSILTNKNFLPQTPTPPTGSAAAYVYRGVYLVAGVNTECTAAGTACTGYALGVDLERVDNTVLAADIDQTVGTAFYGNGDVNCTTANAGAADKCYDMKP